MAMDSAVSYHHDDDDDFTTSSSDSSDYSSSDDDLTSRPKGKVILNLGGGEIPKQLMMRCRVRLQREKVIDMLSQHLTGTDIVDGCTSSDSDVFTVGNRVSESRARPACKMKHRQDQSCTSVVPLTKMKPASAVEQVNADSRWSAAIAMLQNCRNCKVRLVDCWLGKPLPSYLLTEPAEMLENNDSSWKKHKKKKKKKSSKRQVESDDEKPSRTKNRKRKVKSERRRVLVAQDSSEEEERDTDIKQTGLKELSKPSNHCKVEHLTDSKASNKVKEKSDERKASNSAIASPWSETAITAGLPKIPKIKKMVPGSYVPASQEQIMANSTLQSDPYQRLQKREARRREFEKMAAVKYGMSANDGIITQTLVKNVASQPVLPTNTGQAKHSAAANCPVSTTNLPSQPVAANSHMGGVRASSHGNTPVGSASHSPFNCPIPRPPIPGQLHRVPSMGDSGEMQPSNMYTAAPKDHRALLPNPSSCGQMPSPVIPMPKTPLFSDSPYQETDSMSQDGGHFGFQQGLLPEPGGLLPVPQALLPTPQNHFSHVKCDTNADLPEPTHNEPNIWHGDKEDRHYSYQDGSHAWQSSEGTPKKREVTHQKMAADSTVAEDPSVSQEVLDEICRLSLEISKRITKKAEVVGQAGPAIIPLEPDGLPQLAPKEIPLEKSDVVYYDYGHSRPPLPQEITTTTLRAPTPPPSLLAPPIPPMLHSSRLPPAVHESVDSDNYPNDCYQPKDYYAQSPRLSNVEDTPAEMPNTSRSFEDSMQGEESYEDILAAEQERTRKELYYGRLRRNAMLSESDERQSRHSDRMGEYSRRSSRSGYITDSQYEEHRRDEQFYGSSTSHQPRCTDSHRYDSSNQRSRRDLYSEDQSRQRSSMERQERGYSDSYHHDSGYPHSRYDNRPKRAYDTPLIIRDRYGLPVVSSDEEETSTQAPPTTQPGHPQLITAGNSLHLSDSCNSHKITCIDGEDNGGTGSSAQTQAIAQHNSTPMTNTCESKAHVDGGVYSVEPVLSSTSVAACDVRDMNTSTTPATTCTASMVCSTTAQSVAPLNVQATGKDPMVKDNKEPDESTADSQRCFHGHAIQTTQRERPPQVTLPAAVQNSTSLLPAKDENPSSTATAESSLPDTAVSAHDVMHNTGNSSASSVAQAVSASATATPIKACLQSADADEQYVNTQYSTSISPADSAIYKPLKHSTSGCSVDMSSYKTFSQPSFTRLLEKCSKALTSLKSHGQAKETDSSDTKLPSDSSDTKLPSDSSDTKLPSDSSDTKLPSDSSDTKLPSDSSDTKLPSDSSDTKLPSSGTVGTSANIKELGCDALHSTESCVDTSVTYTQGNGEQQGVSNAAPDIPPNARVHVGPQDGVLAQTAVDVQPCSSPKVNQNTGNATKLKQQPAGNIDMQSTSQQILRNGPADPCIALDVDDNKTALFFQNVKAGSSDYQHGVDGKQAIPGLTVIEDSMTANELEQLLGRPQHSFPLSVPELMTELSKQVRVILDNKDSDSVLKAWIQVCLLRDTNKLTFNILTSRNPQLTDLSSIYNKALINILSHQDLFRLVTAAGVQRWLPGLEMHPMVRQSLADVQNQLLQNVPY